jgi:hypothetical protein
LGFACSSIKSLKSWAKAGGCGLEGTRYAADRDVALKLLPERIADDLGRRRSHARDTDCGRARLRTSCRHHSRDLKPGNIMITDGGVLKVLDFGLAKLGVASPDTDAAETPPFAPLTMIGLAVGTPDYMSPEQARGDPVDARSDVFAFGIVLYQMLTGQLPFRGSSRSDHLRQLHFSVPTPVVTLRADVPPALAAVVTKALG